MQIFTGSFHYLLCPRIFYKFLLCCMPLFLQGCFNVNIKSILPDQAYYSLDKGALKSNCKDIIASYGFSVSVLSPFDGKDILLYNDKEEIAVLESHKWIDLPKNMIRNAFIKTGLSHCIQIEQNPPMTQRLSTLRFTINDMHVVLKNDVYSAYMYVTYEILGYDMKQIKHSVLIANADDSNPAIALQKALQDIMTQVFDSLKAKKK